MDEQRVADYFIISGVSDNLEFNTELKPLTTATLPITDIAVVFRGLGEACPEGFKCIEQTPSGNVADLNNGNLRSHNIFVCYKRGLDKPPIIEVGVLYEEKERVLNDIEIIKETPYGKSASISGTNKTYITFRRAKSMYPYNQLVVVDLSVILRDKNECPPPAFHVIVKNLNSSFQGMIGSKVNLCYKKSILSPPSLGFKPQIVSRFPLQDYKKFPLPDTVPLFCLPTGANIELWPVTVKLPLPQSSSFILTSDSAQKIYGSALTFYEHFEDARLCQDQRARIGLSDDVEKNKQFQTYATKSICILSRWPFFECFEKFLFFLHRFVFREYILRTSGSREQSPKKSLSPVNPANQVPVEHYISHFLLDVSFPTQQRPKVLIQLMPGSDEEIFISQPSSNLPLPLTGASFFSLLRNLGVEHTMNVLLFGLSEQKILLHSLIPSLLVGIAEAITAMLFPFHWQCPYVPVCPLSLHGILNAPLPFIVGIDSRCFDRFTPPSDVICIDLDANSIRMSENKRCLTLKALPKRAARVLKSSLERIHEKITRLQQIIGQSPVYQRTKNFESSIQQAKKRIELEVREAFILFMATILKDFRQYLKPITKAPTVGATDPTSLFDFEGFLTSRDRNYSQFYHWITKTQMFTHYIEERSFVSDKDTSLAFFDDCEEKLERSGDKYSYKPIRLFEKEGGLMQDDRSVFIPAPEMSPSVSANNSITNSPMRVPKFGPLNATLFHRHPNKPDNKPLIELDRSDKFDTCDGGKRDEIFYSSQQANALTGVINSHSSFSISRRTKQEVKVSQKQAKKSAESPLLWSKYLVSCCHSIWFSILPSYITHCRMTSSNSDDKTTKETDLILRFAYETITKMKSLQLATDEICFRVLILLCGYYGQPALAVLVYFEMKKSGIIPNAVTYGYYNKAVLESKWPEHLDQRVTTVLWRKIRNVISGITLFKSHGRIAMERRNMKLQQKNLLVENSDLSDENKEISFFEQTHQYIARDLYFPSMQPMATKIRKNRRHVAANRSFTSNTCLTSNENDECGEVNTKRYVKKSKSMHLRKQTRVEETQRSRLGSLEKANKCSSVDDADEYDSDEWLNQSSAKRTDNEDRVVWQRDQLVVDIGSNGPVSLVLNDNELKYIDNLAGDLIQANRDYINQFKQYRTKHLKGQEHQEEESINRKTEAYQTSDESLAQNNTIFAIPSVQCVNHITQTNIIDGVLKPDKFAGDAQIIKKLDDLPSQLRQVPDFYGSEDQLVQVDDERAYSLRENSTSLFPHKCHSINSRSDNETSESRLGASNESNAGSGEDEDPGSQDYIDESNDEYDESDDDVFYKSSSLTTYTPNFRLSSLINDASPWSKWTSSQNPRASVYKGIKCAASGLVSSIQEIKSSFSLSNNATPAKLSTSVQQTKSTMTKEMLSQVANIFSYTSFGFEEVGNACVGRGESRHSGGELSSDEDLFKLSNGEELEPREFDDSRQCAKLFKAFESYYGSLGPALSTDNKADGRDLNVETSLDEDKEPKDSKQASGDIAAIEIWMTTCSRCNVCSSLLYDEEIMDRWSYNDSNLNTKCGYCRAAIVPLLTIDVRDNRTSEACRQYGSQYHGDKLKPEANVATVDDLVVFEEQASKSSPEASPESRQHIQKFEHHKLCGGSHLQTFTVPYLSPIVLWKELESVFESSGDNCAANDQFVDNHPIIFWNLLWFFERVRLPTHLATLVLTAKFVQNGRLASPAPSQLIHLTNILKVTVTTLWDNEKLHANNGKPLYRLWERCEPSTRVEAILADRPHFTRKLLERVLFLIKANELCKAMLLILNERLSSLAQFSFDKNRHNLYRDLLFLAQRALGGKATLCSDKFEREYQRSFKILNFQQVALNRFDKPPSLGSLFCRKLFAPLAIDAKRR